MKKLITAITVSVLLIGCGGKSTPSSPPTLPPWINQVTVSTAFATATSTGLELGVKDAAKRQAMAKLLQYIASQCNTFATAAGDNSPEALATFINNNVPADIKANYPELINFAVPLVVSGYGTIYKNYGNDAQFLSQWLSWVATGVSIGAGKFI